MGVPQSFPEPHRCLGPGCKFWTANQTRICARCHEKGITRPAEPTSLRVAGGKVSDALRSAVAGDPRDAFVTEATVQKGQISLLRKLGWKVYRVGQRDARGTQDEGVSDQLCFHPDDGILFLESKRLVGGRQSRAQKQFQRDVEAAGGVYLCSNSTLHLARFLAERRDQRRARAVTESRNR